MPALARLRPAARALRRLAVGLAGFLLLASASSGERRPRVHALRDARVVVRPGTVIERATILLRDGVIEAVGAAVAIPEDARVWDLAGTTVYAGFVEPYWSRAYPGEDKAGAALAHPSALVRPEREMAGVAQDPATLEALRAAGFTTAALVPGTGLLRGSSAVVALGGSPASSNVLLRRWAHHAAIAPGPEGEYPHSLMGAVALTRQTLLDARWHQTAVEAQRKKPTLPRPPEWPWARALAEPLAGSMPVVFDTQSPHGALRAAKLGREFGLRSILLGSGREYERLAEIRDLRLPLILPVAFPAAPRVGAADDLSVPTETLRHWDQAPSNPRLTIGAGIRVSLTTHGLEKPADLFPALLKAIGRGLTEQQALAALTVEPAALLGLTDRVGTIERGKWANLLVVEGPLFTEKPRLRSVWIDGEAYLQDSPRPAESSTNAAAGAPAAPASGTRAGQAAPEASAEIPWSAPAWPESPVDALIVGATVWTNGPQGVLENADIAIRGGRIAAVGRGLTAPPGTLRIDGRGRHLTPGIIDAHSHTAVEGGINELSNSVTAEVRIADVLDPTDPNIYRQLAGGVTTVNVLHGSANAIGGQNAVIKLRWGAAPEALLLDGAPPGIKFALGENPKRANTQNRTRYPQTRLGVEQLIRERFLAARDAHRAAQAWMEAARRPGGGPATLPPRRDLQLEAVAEILAGKRWVHSHAYRADEMLMLLALADEFGFRVATFQHALEAYKIADEIAARRTGASLFTDWWGYKFEVFDAIPWAGALAWKRGVLTSFNSDSDELARRLNLEAAKAVRYGGVPDEEALAFVTLNPARQLGIDHRVGSLEPGKDADFAIWSGHPLSSLTRCEETWVDGRRAFSRTADLERRSGESRRRDELLARARRATKPPPEEGPGTPAAQADTAATLPAWTAAAPAAGPAGAASGDFALVGVIAHTIAQGTIEDATVVVRDGRIAAVGRQLRVPEGLAVIDGAGQHLWPGIVHPFSTLGLVEVSSVRGTVDQQEVGDNNADLRAIVAFNADSLLLPAALAGGVVAAHVVPGGGFFNGQSAVVALDGWNVGDMAIAPAAGFHLTFPATRRDPSPGNRQTDAEFDKQKADQIRLLDRTLDDARAYARARAAAASGSAPTVDFDPKLEPFRPYVEGDARARPPIFLRARSRADIEEAIDWVERQNLGPIVLVSGSDAQHVADRLARRSIPVILDGVLALPPRGADPYDEAYAAAARLHEAGVRFAFADQDDTANSRNLPFHAAMAVAFGLPREVAHRALTLGAAEILGVAGRLGSIEPGKDASFFLADGDPLEVRTSIRQVWVSGSRVDPSRDRQRQLFERYDRRPAATVVAPGGPR